MSRDNDHHSSEQVFNVDLVPKGLLGMISLLHSEFKSILITPVALTPMMQYGSQEKLEKNQKLYAELRQLDAETYGLYINYLKDQCVNLYDIDRGNVYGYCKLPNGKMNAVYKVTFYKVPNRADALEIELL